jgi:TPR repeat protein
MYLGIIMLKGLLGLPVNTKEAVTWLKRASENANEENPQALNVLVLSSHGYCLH